MEAKVLEKLMALDVEARHRVIDAAVAADDNASTRNAWDAWLKEADVLREELSKKYPGRAKIDVLLREVREED
jgi:hypothetical protein